MPTGSEPGRARLSAASFRPNPNRVGGKPDKVFKPGRKARHVLAAFELRDTGLPFAEIGRRFGWSDSTTRQILANDVYIGVVQHGGFVNENAHEPIVPRDLFDRVQMMRTATPAATGELTRDLVLQGIAVCAGCGHTLKVPSRKRADGSRVLSYYYNHAASDSCPDRHSSIATCSRPTFVMSSRRRSGTTPRLVDVVTVGLELDAAQKEREKAVEQLNAFIENAEVTNAELLQRGIAARERRVEEARDKEQQLSAAPSEASRWWLAHRVVDRFEPAERREVLAGFLGRVVVSKGASTSLEEHVIIEWADGTVATDEARVRVAAA